MSGPRAAAVIVEYRAEEACRACLESIRQSAGVEALPVLVDQNPTPCSTLATAAEAAGGIAISIPENLGFAGGANRGIDVALRTLDPRTVIVLNADARVAPGCLSRLDDVLHSDPVIGLAGAGLLAEGTESVWWNAGSEIAWPSARPRSLLHGEARSSAAARDAVRDTDFVCGSVFAFRPDVWRRLGPIPEEYFLYFEDADYSYRARQACLRTVVVLDAIAWHGGGGSLAGLAAVAGYYRARNRLRFSRAWSAGQLRRRLHRGLFGIRTILRSCVRFAAGGGREALLPARGVLDYARGRSGKLR